MYREPCKDDYAAVSALPDEELLEFFLFRICETDEVWGLRDGPLWVTREIDGRETLPLWPYRHFAEEAAAGEWQNLAASAESLEFFLYRILNKLAMQNVSVEIMPRTTGPGCLVSPQKLFDLLESLLESSQCSLDD